MIRRVDVLVVGGGIHGAGCAQAAAAAGHSVLLLEQRALAAGSSSRSSKLIHGGLRYLESGQWRLVRESLHERTTLLRLAPELVKLRRFHIPLYRETRRRGWQLRVGLATYAALAGFDRSARFGTVPRRRWDQLDGLRGHGLRNVFWYHDAQTDDRLLTEAVVRSAQSLGADLCMPARFAGAQLISEGVIARYREGDRESECQARVLINAAGPWAAGVARTLTPAIDVPRLELVQGSHLLLDRPASERLYYVESPRDGRAVFVLPWHGHTLVGTTEVRFRGDPGRVQPSPQELNYLLGVYRHYFGERHRPLPPLLDAFAGLRVLPAGAGHAFHRSRETLLLPDRAQRPRVLCIYGGKLTTWRAVAAHVQAMLAASLPANTPRARTDRLPLRPA
jgi:glycerol-3-phosphate dehydrogenase